MGKTCGSGCFVSFFSFLFKIRHTQLQSTFNKNISGMMYYLLYNGREKTSLHPMTGHTVYDKCKSRELITSLSGIVVSCSYNEVRKAKSNLANYPQPKVKVYSSFVELFYGGQIGWT